MCFSPLFGVSRGKGCLPRGPGHSLLVRFSSLGSSKMKISETNFFDFLTILNDKVSYVTHVLVPFCMFFTQSGCLMGVRGGGGGSQGGRGPTF